MSIDSRLRKLEKGMTYHEKALLWLKTLQAKGGYSDYWKFAEFEPWQQRMKKPDCFIS